MDNLKDDIRSVRGIGPKKAARLLKLGVQTLEDMLGCYPRAYEHIGQLQTIKSIAPGETVSLRVHFAGRPKVARYRRGFSVASVPVSDGTGSIQCVWYNQPFRSTLYNSDTVYSIRGKAVANRGRVLIENPVVELYDPAVHDNPSILPVYPLTDGISQRDLRQLAAVAISRLNSDNTIGVIEDAALDIGLMGRLEAVKAIHFPDSSEQAMEARRRLAFDEFLFSQLAFQTMKRQNHRPGLGIPFTLGQNAAEAFLKKLPFSLTASQLRVLEEIFKDLGSGNVMNRLLQGDVGSGKTIIAAAALLAAVKSGYQGALMVPTSVLAKQHFNTFLELFRDEGIRIELLTGSLRPKEKQDIKDRLISGDIDLVIGTHAVITEDVAFRRLGLVVTDEQHRFGVRQRALLEQKGHAPHVLVMSATPIPRTIAHILYGDLDLSTIDELPAGRVPIRTFHIGQAIRERAYGFIKKEVKVGRQAYVIAPLVEDTEKTEAASAAALYKELGSGLLSGLKLGLLHGRMGSDEKESIMEEFVSGSIDVLISTTVIEVGINVPNATVILIENAERFGLAQLHQLRGRVGRGNYASYCILVSNSDDNSVREKLGILVKSGNGFEIAEKDLAMRGPGDLLGLRQHGLPGFRLANPVADGELFRHAREAAAEILDKHGEFAPVILLALEKFEGMRSGVAMN